MMFLIESNQAYGSMVSCFFRQSDCSLARLVHVCLLQSLWWTSAVSRPSALRSNVVNPFFVFCGLSQFWILLKCAAPPRYRFGAARVLYYNARCRHPVCVLQSFNSVGVMNFQENTKTNRNPQNATCEKPEPQTTSQGPNPTAPQASSDLLRDTQPTQGTLQRVHLRMSIFFKLHCSILLKVSRKQVWFVRKRRSNDSSKANEPIVDSIGPKSHPSDVQPF